MSEHSLSEVITNLGYLALRENNIRGDGGMQMDIVQESVEITHRINDLCNGLIAVIENENSGVEISELVSAMNLIKGGALTEYFARRSDSSMLLKIDRVTNALHARLIEEMKNEKHLEKIMSNPVARCEYFEFVITYILHVDFSSQHIGALRIALERLPKNRYTSEVVDGYLTARAKSLLRELADKLTRDRYSQEYAEEFKNYARMPREIESKIQ